MCFSLYPVYNFVVLFRFKASFACMKTEQFLLGIITHSVSEYYAFWYGIYDSTKITYVSSSLVGSYTMLTGK